MCLQAQLNQTCNIFGGEAACQQLPSDSKFAAVCNKHDLKVASVWLSMLWAVLAETHVRLEQVVCAASSEGVEFTKAETHAVPGSHPHCEPR